MGNENLSDCNNHPIFTIYIFICYYFEQTVAYAPYESWNVNLSTQIMVFYDPSKFQLEVFLISAIIFNFLHLVTDFIVVIFRVIIQYLTLYNYSPSIKALINEFIYLYLLIESCIPSFMIWDYGLNLLYGEKHCFCDNLLSQCEQIFKIKLCMLVFFIQVGVFVNSCLFRHLLKTLILFHIMKVQSSYHLIIILDPRFNAYKYL